MTNPPSNTLEGIPLVTVEPRKLNERLWELHRKSIDRSIAAAEIRELDLICQAIETEQDDWLVIERLPCGGVVL